MKKLLMLLIILQVLFISCLENNLLEQSENIKPKAFYDEAIENYVLVFEVEGNFITTEFDNYGIQTVVCSIPSTVSSKELTLSIPNYSTANFTKIHNIQNSPLKDIATEIVVDDFTYGYVADINKNGLDEICFYRLNNTFFPEFYEFSPTENRFIRILPYDGPSVFATELDVESKRFTFYAKGTGNNSNKQIKKIYTWSDNTNQYEIIEQVTSEITDVARVEIFVYGNPIEINMPVNKLVEKIGEPTGSSVYYASAISSNDDLIEYVYNSGLKVYFTRAWAEVFRIQLENSDSHISIKNTKFYPSISTQRELESVLGNGQHVGENEFHYGFPTTRDSWEMDIVKLKYSDNGILSSIIIEALKASS